MVPTELIQYITKRTHFKARQIVRKCSALGAVEDVQQDLIMDVLRRLPKFDSSRAGIKTFVCRLIDFKIASLLKSKDAACRGNGCIESSLDDWTHDENGAWAQRGETIDESRGRAHLGAAPRSDQEQRSLEIDIAVVVATLSPEQRELCERLKTQTPTEISRDTGMSRSAIYQRVVAIRAIFVAAKLDLYV